MNQHGRHMRGILLELASGEALSQRRLSNRLGIALGLTNLLLRRVIAKGWVKVVHVQPHRVRYLLTPAGIAAKARLTREYLEGTLQFYADARERVRERFTDLSRDFDGQPPPKRIAFYGAGEIAEIGYVSLQETDLLLVAVVDDARTRPFFGMPVHRPAALTASAVGECGFDRLVVMSFETGPIRAHLESVGVAPGCVFWI